MTEWNGAIEGEQFILGALVKVVRLAAGPDWNPSRVKLESSSSVWIREVDELRDTEVEFGGTAMALAVPYDLLDRRISPPQPPAGGPDRAPEVESLPRLDFAGSLQQLLEPLVSKTSLWVELGAEIAEVSPRTLRRWLAREGTSWRGLTDRVRFDTCKLLLRDPALKLSEIACEVGYSDHAHFTRAFRRWTGESPTEFRRRRI